MPVLEARAGTTATRLAALLHDRAPLAVYAATLLLGYVLVAALIVGLGFVLVDVLLPIHAIGHSDEAVNTWLAAHRDGTLNDASFYGSAIGDVPVLPIVVTLVVIAAAIARRWRIVGFVLGAILVEVATYRVASLIVHRHRPYVVRLDQLPVEQSFPSGHVAASIAVYASLAIVVSSWARRRAVTVTAWSVAIALPILVASSRMYRGMHHPLDVASVALVAARAAVAAAEARDGATR